MSELFFGLATVALLFVSCGLALVVISDKMELSDLRLRVKELDNLLSDHNLVRVYRGEME